MVLDWLIIGLGNPGKRYEGTLHNAGFSVLDLLFQACQRTAPVSWKAAGPMLCAELRSSLAPEILGNVLLVKPQTYMNLSGKILLRLRKAYEWPPQRCIVLLDNLDLPPGNLRLKLGGGFSSHKGLRSLREGGMTADFWRFFIGIGHPGSPEQVSDYVLNKPRRADAERYNDALERAEQHLFDILRGKLPEELIPTVNRKLYS
ncbi:MAG: aminoacyl-tRNA hydrolase [Spirochaetota bacterium]